METTIGEKRLMRYLELLEGAPQTVSAAIFAMAKAAHSSLSDDARRAIDAWESMNWTGGALEQHLTADDNVAQEIERTFAPIRAKLPERVTLYRGIIRDGSYTNWDKAVLQSWTSDRRTAELFAGLRSHQMRSRLHDDITDEQIAQAVAQYERTGYVRFLGRHYLRNKDNPRYYDIYDKDKQYVTDGDDLQADFSSDQQHRRESNAEKKSKSHVFEEVISRDRIVWITNTLNCKEFLVRR